MVGFCRNKYNENHKYYTFVHVFFLNGDEGGGLLGHVAVIPRHHDQLEIEKEWVSLIFVL